MYLYTFIATEREMQVNQSGGSDLTVAFTGNLQNR